MVINTIKRTMNLGVIDIAKWIAAISVIAGTVWSIGALFGVLVWRSYGAHFIEELGLASRDDIVEVKRAIGDAQEVLSVLTRQIEVLSRPDDIVIYRDLPEPADGSCMAGQPCTIVIFAERSEGATACRIVPDRTELRIAADGREYIAGRAAGRRGTNLPARPQALEPTFDMPQSLPVGRAMAFIRSYYEGCPWQVNGQPPAIQDSPMFPIEVIE